MKVAQYTHIEARIVSRDSDSIRERWLWGLRLLADPDKIAPAGGLRHGVTDALIEAATKRGYKLSDREIRYRLQCARAYPTETQIGKAIADFKTWFDLISAAFPVYEAPLFEPRADWRTDAEQMHDRSRAFLDKTSAQETLFPLNQFEPVETTLADLELYLKDQDAKHESIVAGHQHTRSKRRTYLDELEAAVGHDLTATWQHAMDCLGGSASEG